jgi:polar amino acid transport system substrate-binding protein
MARHLVWLLALLIFPALAQAGPACPALVITGHPSYPPVAWAADGRIVGAAADLVASIAGQLGVKQVESVDFGSWERAQEAARAGRADVIFGIYRNDERATYLDYIDPPFMPDPVVVAVRKGDGFAFAHWGDLKGRRGVTNRGESYGDRFDAFMASELAVARSEGVEKAFDALLGKQADYMIIGLYPGKREAERLGIEGRIEFLPVELETADMYVAFARKSKCYEALGAGFSARLRDAVERGAVRALLEAAEKRPRP